MYEPDYILKLRDGREVKLLFLFWAFRTYSERKGIEYEDLVNGCFQKPDGGIGETLKINNIPGILLIGAECWCKVNREPFTYSDLDADLWMDEIDWRGSEILKEIGIVFACKLLRIDKKDLDVKQQEKEERAEDKKKEESPLLGGNSLLGEPQPELSLQNVIS